MSWISKLKVPFPSRPSLDATIIGPDIFVVSHCCHFSKCFVNKILGWTDIRCLVNVWIELHVLHYRELFRGHNSWLFNLAISFSIWTNDLRRRFLSNKCRLLLNICKKKKGVFANVKTKMPIANDWSTFRTKCPIYYFVCCFPFLDSLVAQFLIAKL